MKHKNDVKLPPMDRKPHPVRDELLSRAIKATNSLGGIAMIDDRYVIVDTERYSISPK
jgi:hypothetical protein